MKKYILLLSFIIFIPVHSFAWIDGSVYGGYTFLGNVEVADANYDDVTGYDYGAMAHLNLNLSFVLLGFGLNYQAGSFKYDAGTENADFRIKSSWGPDFLLIIKISEKANPFARIGFSIADNLEYDYGIEKKDKTRFLNSGWWALGYAFQPVSYIMIFAEYQRCGTNLNEDHTLVRNTGHLGIMFLF
jgi:hypothetical protein